MDLGRRKKLNRLIWRQRLRTIIPVFAILVALLALSTLYLYDQSNSEKIAIRATVQSWSRAQTEEGSGAYLIWVKLADGTRVLAKANRNGSAPVAGEIIVVEQAKSKLGRISYRWNR